MMLSFTYQSPLNQESIFLGKKNTYTSNDRSMNGFIQIVATCNCVYQMLLP